MKERSVDVPLLLSRVINRLARPFGINPFPRAFEYGLQAEQASLSFDTIYRDNSWGSEASRSGVGSELESTSRYRAGLVQLIRERGFTSLFDAPCGDLHWMPHLLQQVSLRYQGGDISPTLIADLSTRYPEYSLREFNICKDPFPQAEVWHCRDCLFHLPFADITAALRNFVSSEIPYALLTTHRARWLHRNLDLNGVGFRFLDLEYAPFHFPPALAYMPDYRFGPDFPKHVGLWSRDMIQAALARMDNPLPMLEQK